MLLWHESQSPNTQSRRVVLPVGALQDVCLCAGLGGVVAQSIIVAAFTHEARSVAQPQTWASPQATAKDGKVLLAWEPPADGACVSQYIVNVMDAALPASLQVGNRAWCVCRRRESAGSGASGGLCLGPWVADSKGRRKCGSVVQSLRMEVRAGRIALWRSRPRSTRKPHLT